MAPVREAGSRWVKNCASFLTNREDRVPAISPGPRECHLLTTSLKE